MPDENRTGIYNRFRTACPPCAGTGASRKPYAVRWGLRSFRERTAHTSAWLRLSVVSLFLATFRSCRGSPVGCEFPTRRRHVRQPDGLVPWRACRQSSAF